MPLALNLLHEELREQRQRKRDPLKISMMVGIGIAALLALNYLWGGYKLLELKSKLSAAEREWAKVEPKVSQAQKRAEELTTTINATKVLDDIAENRFYWAPLLSQIAHCVTPNIQLTSLEGGADEDKGVTLSMEGTAAGREPRAVAEDFRQMLIEQVGKDRSETKVEFKTLEDLDTAIALSGANMPTAHFNLTVSFNPYPKKVEKAAPARKKREQQE